MFTGIHLFQVYHPPERRTQQEQVNDLLGEVTDEVELDSRRPDPVQEISARLAQLREPDPDDAPAEGKSYISQ